MNSRIVHCSSGHPNLNGSRFCTTCGTALTSPTATTEPEVPVIPSLPTMAAPDLNKNDNQLSSANASLCCYCGNTLADRQAVCNHCGGIKPIHPDYQVDPSIFQWSLDGQAMARLRSIKPLVAVAQSVSSRIGKPWIEANFNGIRLSPRQMPHIYSMAVQAARILGLRRMPSIYVSGARPWDALTFGSDTDAFIVIGSALVSCFQKSELMFLFAREMGHILAGHALWKTVIQFLVGEQQTAGGLMRKGVAGLLDPARLIEGAIELPLIAWARQAEITADRAGLLVSAGLEQARKTLIIWSLKSPALYQHINLAAWIEQQELDSSDGNIRLAEAVSTSTPYLTRRLNLMQEYENSIIVHQFRRHVMSILPRSAKPAAKPNGAPAVRVNGLPLNSSIGANKATPASVPLNESANAFTTNADQPEHLDPSKSRTIRVLCSGCQQPLTFNPDDAKGKTEIAIKCPNNACGKISLLRQKRQPEPTSDAVRSENLANM